MAVFDITSGTADQTNSYFHECAAKSTVIVLSSENAIMDRLPIFLKLDNESCLIVGGGEVAERKVRMLLRVGGTVTVVAPDITPGLRHRLLAREIRHIPQRYDKSMLKAQRMVVVATDNKAINRRISIDAAKRGVICNVVDDNELSTFTLPAIVDRSPVVIAIGTEGAAPVLARQLKFQIERRLPARIGELADFAKRLRPLVKSRFSSMLERRRFWEQFFAGPVKSLFLSGQRESAEQVVRKQLAGKLSGTKTGDGVASIVGAGPGDPELLTLKAHRIISSADVVVYDRLVSNEILDLARKDAEFIEVGKRPGGISVSQDRINELLVEKTAAGLRVCRLKGGDPFVFGRGGEEVIALKTANLAFEVVPGITAAIGCAASARVPLTLRENSTSVTLATAKLAGNTTADWAKLLHAGDTLAVYMGVAEITGIRNALLGLGVDRELPVTIVENGTRPEQRVIETSLSKMALVANSRSVRNPAMLYLGYAVAALGVSGTDVNLENASYILQSQQAAG